MSRKKKKYRRNSSPKFKKSYLFTPQDEYLLADTDILQKTYSKIAYHIFHIPRNRYQGDWTMKIFGLNFFYDPVFGHQAEICGTSNLPLSKRLIIHLELLKYLRGGYSILKAVKLCILTLMKQ